MPRGNPDVYKQASAIPSGAAIRDPQVRACVEALREAVYWVANRPDPEQDATQIDIRGGQGINVTRSGEQFLISLARTIIGGTTAASAGGGPPVKVTGGGPGEYHEGDVYEDGFDAAATEEDVILRFPGLAGTETVPVDTELPSSNPITEDYLGASATVYYVSVKVAL